MLPILLDIKIFKIYTFGVFLLLAFLWGLFFLWREVKLTSYKEEEVFDSVFVTLFWSLFSSRLLYVALNFNQFGFDILKFILVNGFPGLSAYGALLGGIGALYLHAKRKKMEFAKLVDYFIPGLFVAVGIAKIGSFLSGVEPGTETNFLLSVVYSGYKGTRHIPAVYESIIFFTGSFVAHKIILSIRRQHLPQGFALTFFLFVFSLSNLFLDKLKQNHIYFLGFDFNLMISAALSASLGFYFIYFWRKSIVAYVKNSFKSTFGRTHKKTAKSGKKSPKKD